ncbi:hypothetical protein ABEB36_012373 [Hypothenemus hampei]|uniref:UDP-glucuronosyltransferase n=1 Tax=Hypothenemus hampei TaxID=57062 RepID=A0ABD1EB07_HYPHA
MSLKFLFLLTLISLSANYGYCYKILGVFAFPGISHNILTSKLMRGLLEAGHDVTMVATIPLKDVPPKGGKYNEILLDGIVQNFEALSTNKNMFDMTKDNLLLMLVNMAEHFKTFNTLTFTDPKVQQLIHSGEKFDAVVLEQFNNDGLKVFAHIFDCPLIILSSMGPNSWVNNLVGNPSPVSYASHFMVGDFSKDLSIYNRASNLFAYISDYFISNFYLLPQQDAAIREHFPDAPPFGDLYTNVSLILLNSHISYYPALPVVPNMVEVGGYFIDPPKELPKDVKDILDNSPEGVIYFSMGSNLKSKDLPLEKREFILRVLGKLKEKVLWKFEEDLPDRPKNVLIRKWLPQQDILAHPNIKLFITHGGLLSTTETIYHGVPILAIPVFGDQNANADRAVAGGYGLKLEYLSSDFTEENLEKKLNELLHNPQYRNNVKSKQKLFHDRPEKPMKTAVYWVEYAIRHKGAPHLRVAGAKLPWYKYYMVDVLAVILLALLVVYKTGKCVVQKLFGKIKQTVSSEKKKN